METKDFDLLRLAVFQKDEVFFLKSGDRLAFGVRGDYIHDYQAGGGAELW